MTKLDKQCIKGRRANGKSMKPLKTEYKKENVSRKHKVSIMQKYDDCG